MNRDQAKRLAPLLDPLAPAEPELHVQKPEPALDALREAWVFGADKGSHCLLVGARGTGKSTELRHLASAIALETDAPVVTLLRLQQQLDTGQISAAQVLFLLGVASLTLVAKSPPAAITRDLERAYAGVIQGDTGDFSVETLVSQLSLLVGGAAKATGNPLVGALISGGSGLVKAAPRHLALPGRGLRLRANEPAISQLAEAAVPRSGLSLRNRLACGPSSSAKGPRGPAMVSTTASRRRTRATSQTEYGALWKGRGWRLLKLGLRTT